MQLRKFFFAPFISLLCVCNVVTVLYAQDIHVVSNPNRPDIFAWTGSGALSGYTGAPVVLNNSLVVEYNPTGTSDLTQIKQQLAVYSKAGDSLKLIPNPDAGQGVYFQSIQIVFDSKLFFIYKSASGGQRLASFDGNAVTVYPNPDASTTGFIGSPRILNNTLYVAYQNAANVTQFARFNGSGLTLIPNPDASPSGFFNNYSAVFNGKIVSRYVSAAGPRQLATFDGNQWTLLPNPDNTPNRGVQPVFPTLYKNKLYFVYYSATAQYQLLQYDGVNNSTLIANPQNSSSNSGGPTITDGMSIVYNDTLFFQYYDINNVYRLAKFDGSSISLVTNPDATTYGYWYTPINYNNRLYILYRSADGLRRLAQYASATGALSLISNPDAGQGYWDKPIVYSDKLYLIYLDAQNNYRLGSFDGSALALIENPPGIYGSTGNNGYMGQPIIWDDKLFMQMGSVPYNYAGNLAYFTVEPNGICPGSNTSFASDVTGSSYQWQVDDGSGTFTNLTNTAPYSTVTTSALTLIAPSSSLYGYKYRCLVSGNTYSKTFTLRFASEWTGAVSTAWEAAGNWSCNAIPDANTDVYISPGKPNAPSVNSTRSVRSIRLQSGATVSVATNQKLTVTGK